MLLDRQCVSRRRSMHGGFTLIELLVVMGIIVLLMSILIPVAARVRKASYETSTSAELARIAAAVQAYYNDFRALPGPIAENDIDSNTTPGVPAMIGGQPLQDANMKAVTVTSSQNLALGLLGGTYLQFTSNAVTGWVYDPKAVKQGPQSLNTSLSSQKRSNAYLDPSPAELSPQDATGMNYLAFGNDAYAGTNFGIPTFQDHIPGNILGQTGANVSSFSFGPILYFRARVGRPGIVTLTNPTAAGTTLQYDLSEASPYNFSAASTADFPVGSYPDSSTAYFANPGILNQPRGKDSFILISAGSDRLFGTKDDIIYSN